MSKHPTPWKLNHHEVILDANERFVCAPTSDPETRAVLLHAAEMFTGIQRLTAAALESDEEKRAFGALAELEYMIESEIAARKP